MGKKVSLKKKSYQRRKCRFTGQWWFAKHWRLGEIIHLASVLLYRESYKSCNHYQTAQPVPLLFFHPGW